MTNKNELRRYHLAHRNAMTHEEVAGFSRLIERRVLADPRIAQQPLVMTYLSTRNEVDTLSLAKKLLQRNVQVAVPVMPTVENPDFEWSLIENLHALVEGPYGILQPAADACRFVQAQSETPVLIPAVAVDPASGHRIGHGSGHFDRCLQGHRGLKVALVYENQLCESFSTEAHDVPVDAILTEARSYAC